MTAGENLEHQKSTKYLKQGEGTARFGRLGKPFIGFRHQRPQHWPEENSVKFTSTLMTTADYCQPVQKFIGAGNGCASTLLRGKNCGQSHNFSLSDTEQFEQLERDVDHASISDDSASFYQQFISGVQRFPEKRRSSPRIAEVTEHCVKRFPHRVSGGGEKEKGDNEDNVDNIETGTINSLRSSELGSNHGQSEPIPVTSTSVVASAPVPQTASTAVLTSSSAVVSVGPVAGSQQPPLFAHLKHSNIQPPIGSFVQRAPSVPPLSSFAVPATKPLHELPGMAATVHSEADKLIGHLRARLALFDRDYADFKERERDAMERTELLKIRLREQEMDLCAEKAALENEKAEFDKYRNEELLDIKKTRESVEKMKAKVEKKETEEIKLLKEQIVDLQNDICERDSRCSSQRAKIRQLELTVSKLSAELGDAKADIERSKERTKILEDTNSQLRLRVATQGTRTAAVSPGIQKKVLEKEAEPAKKSVRFDLPPFRERDLDCNEEFFRTDNQGTQTSFLISPVQNEPASSSQAASGSSRDHMLELERTLPDGSVETIYKNGTSRVVGSDGVTLTYRYRNGDSRRILPGGTEVYCYADKGVTVITEPSGERVIRFADGREEQHLPDGTKKVKLKDREIISSPDGQRIENHTDGTRLVEEVDGVTTVYFKDGTKEARCKDYTRREWPNGDVKIMYLDGTVESRYQDGRVRIKDSQGLVVRDDYL